MLLPYRPEFIRLFIKIAPVSILILLLAGFDAASQQLHTYVDRDSLRAGDLLTYTLVLDHEQDYDSVQFPDESHFPGDHLQFIDRERHRISARRDSVVYRLQFFAVEDIDIPRLDVTLIDSESDTTSVQSIPVRLHFKSILAEGDEEFRPLKPIFDFAAAWWPWILALLLLVLALWYLYRRFLDVEEKPEPVSAPEPEPFADPFAELELKLDALSGSGSPLKERNFKEFYVQLGDAIRSYFEDVYEIGALEMTSGEIIRELRAYSADRDVIDSTRKVLQEADLVKFARFEPDITQARHALDIGREFLNVVRKIDRERVEKMRQQHEATVMKTTERTHNDLG